MQHPESQACKSLSPGYFANNISLSNDAHSLARTNCAGKNEDRQVITSKVEKTKESSNIIQSKVEENYSISRHVPKVNSLSLPQSSNHGKNIESKMELNVIPRPLVDLKDNIRKRSTIKDARKLHEQFASVIQYANPAQIPGTCGQTLYSKKNNVVNESLSYQRDRGKQALSHNGTVTHHFHPGTFNPMVMLPHQQFLRTVNNNYAGTNLPGLFAPLNPETIFGDMKLRRGKWTVDEEIYANCLIKEFENGLLPDCENGCTLRAYLSRKLHCAPMRISKKYAGKSIGKHVFLCRSRGKSGICQQVNSRRRMEYEQQFYVSITNERNGTAVPSGLPPNPLALMAPFGKNMNTLQPLKNLQIPGLLPNPIAYVSPFDKNLSNIQQVNKPQNPFTSQRIMEQMYHNLHNHCNTRDDVSAAYSPSSQKPNQHSNTTAQHFLMNTVNMHNTPKIISSSGVHKTLAHPYSNISMFCENKLTEENKKLKANGSLTGVMKAIDFNPAVLSSNVFERTGGLTERVLERNNVDVTSIPDFLSDFDSEGVSAESITSKALDDFDQYLGLQPNAFEATDANSWNSIAPFQLQVQKKATEENGVPPLVNNAESNSRNEQINLLYVPVEGCLFFDDVSNVLEVNRVRCDVQAKTQVKVIEPHNILSAKVYENLVYESVQAASKHSAYCMNGAFGAKLKNTSPQEDNYEKSSIARNRKNVSCVEVNELCSKLTNANKSNIMKLNTKGLEEHHSRKRHYSSAIDVSEGNENYLSSVTTDTNYLHVRACAALVSGSEQSSDQGSLRGPSTGSGTDSNSGSDNASVDNEGSYSASVEGQSSPGFKSKRARVVTFAF